MKSRLEACIPSSLLGKTASVLLMLVFLIFPFQKRLFFKLLEPLSYSIIPVDLNLPDYFSKRFAIFFSDFLLLLLLFHVLRAKKWRWDEFFWSGASKYLTLWLIVAFFSIGASSASHYLLMYTRLVDIALMAILFNGIKTAFDAKTIVPFITTLAWILFAISLFESIVALAQYFSQSRVGLKLLGECNRQQYGFHMPHGYTNLVDALCDIRRPTELIMRSLGTFPHPNIFGGFQFCTILATFYLYFTQSIKKYKLCLLFGLPLQFLGLTVAFSRASIIALLMASLFWFLMQLRLKEMRKAVIHLSCMLLVPIVFCLALFYPQLAARGGVVNYNNLVKEVDAERVTYQNMAIEMVKENPFLGVGFNNFQLHSHRFFPDERILFSKVHNIYLLFAAETGLIGASLIILFLFSILKNIINCFRSQEGLFLSSMFMGLLFIGLCDFYLVSFPHGRILFFGTAGLLYVVSKKTKKYAAIVPM